MIEVFGNDAAHVEARAYREIGEKEVDAALALARELIKAVYQYRNLLLRLQGMRNKGP